jgi:hypothetical protein
MPDKKKTEKYESERNLIYERLMNMLNYNEDNSFTLDEIDKNTELQNQIVGLTDDIRKYYSASGCRGCREERGSKRPFMSIIRYIVRQNRKTLYSTEIAIPLGDNKYKKTTKYKIF